MTRNVNALFLLVLASVAAAACSDPIPYPGPPTPSAPTPGPQTERPIMPPAPSPWTVPPPELPEGIELTELEMGEPAVLRRGRR